jgi:tetratricopeptide (TPR) repeat protein
MSLLFFGCKNCYEMKNKGSVVSLLLLVLIALTNCQNSPNSLEDTIAQMEKKISPPYTADQADQLIKIYQDYAFTYPDRNDQDGLYLKKAATVAIESEQYSQAIELLTTAIKDHFSAKNTKENILLLAEVYQKYLNNENIAATVLQSAQRQFPEESSFTQQIQPQWPALEIRLEDLKKGVMDTVQKQINYTYVNDYILSCAAYAMILPEDTLSPRLLFEAGQLAHQTQTYNEALELLDWMCLEYPEHPMAADALFLNGYILDSELKRFDEAKQRYEAFLERYPDNEFAETTQFLLDNLGVPAEEIIKRFENQ